MIVETSLADCDGAFKACSEVVGEASEATARGTLYIPDV